MYNKLGWEKIVKKNDLVGRQVQVQEAPLGFAFVFLGEKRGKIKGEPAGGGYKIWCLPPTEAQMKKET